MGFFEWLLVLLVALLVLGPKQLPVVARVAGRSFAKCRRAWAAIKDEVAR